MRRPCDFHTHLRSPAQVGEHLFRLIVEMNCEHYRYVVVEPNTFLDPSNEDHHIETAEDMERYRDLVLAALPKEYRCEPLFLIKLTPHTTPAVIRQAKAAGCIGCKLYPDGVTTGSDVGGVSCFDSPNLLAALACLEEENMVLQIHPEMPRTFCLDRENAFQRVMADYVQRFSQLRIFVEHMTDGRTVNFVRVFREHGCNNLYGTITGHHLKLTLDDVLGQVDHHCWPCAKRPHDRDDLVTAALGAAPSIVSITDSAPHEYHTKHGVKRGCAGVFNPSVIAVPHLVSLFANRSKLENAEGFTSGNGCAAYHLPIDDSDTIELVREDWVVPHQYCAAGRVTPFLAGETLPWRIVS